MKKQINDFIKEHSHINYCEAIIYPDGMIEYATPSHIEALITVTGLSHDKVYELMPITAAPIEWLTNYTGCVSVWYQGFIKPKHITNEQMNSMTQLMEHGIVSKRFFY